MQPVPEDDEDLDLLPPAITINPAVKRKSSSDSEGSDGKRMRRPGPASRTNAPTENRAAVKSSNIPLHLLESQLEESSNGYKCPECDKVCLFVCLCLFTYVCSCLCLFFRCCSTSRATSTT